ncbi:hypothetical protein [uncultured Sphingomonas sp.]|uniref:hypothetical protein n=1 Tax=uncultured Sphingomonas sp. TaxID=158754 RepID=UPI0025EBEB8B|nr:hypothetical protein [uncultured Sphingomonas sp.]
MKHFLTAAVALVAVGAACSADADRGDWRRRDQDEAFAARRAGQIMPLRQIESRIVPSMRGADYLGPDFDPGSGVYRLKFMRGGSVIFVDVDGRTGQVVGRSGY